MYSTTMVSYSAILVLALLPGANTRLFTVVNTCSFTIWHVPTPHLLSLCVHEKVLTFDGDTGPPWVPSDISPHSLLMLSQIYTDLSVSQNVPPFPTGRVQPFLTSSMHSLIRVSLYI